MILTCDYLVGDVTGSSAVEAPRQSLIENSHAHDCVHS